MSNKRRIIRTLPEGIYSPPAGAVIYTHADDVVVDYTTEGATPEDVIVVAEQDDAGRVSVIEGEQKDYDALPHEFAGWKVTPEVDLPFNP